MALFNAPGFAPGARSLRHLPFVKSPSHRRGFERLSSRAGLGSEDQPLAVGSAGVKRASAGRLRCRYGRDGVLSVAGKLPGAWPNEPQKAP
jgi:hypothetical protein